MGGILLDLEVCAVMLIMIEGIFWKLFSLSFATLFIVYFIFTVRAFMTRDIKQFLWMDNFIIITVGVLFTLGVVFKYVLKWQN
jgi:hypothetical protein